MTSQIAPFEISNLLDSSKVKMPTFHFGIMKKYESEKVNFDLLYVDI